METSITQFQEEICQILNRNPWFAEHNTHWLAENAMDVVFESKKSLAETGIACIVSTPKLNYQGIDGDNENFGFDVTIELQIIENPTINRGRPSAETALSIAHVAAYTLGGFKTGNFNNFTFSDIEQTTVGSAGNKLIQVTATFNSTVIL